MTRRVAKTTLVLLLLEYRAHLFMRLVINTGQDVSLRHHDSSSCWTPPSLNNVDIASNALSLQQY